MIKTLATALITLTLVGCGTMPRPSDQQIVYVDRPIATFPKPPSVPQFDSKVAKLSAGDESEPGKVSNAYIYDITFLRWQVQMYKKILEQYEQSAFNFDEINAKIKLMTDGAVNKTAPLIK